MDSKKVFLGTVAHTFVISGRPGVIVVPQDDWSASFKVGDSLLLEKPDGELLKVRISGIEMTTPPLLNRRKEAVLLQAENLSKEGVPLQSKLWLLKAE